MVKSMTGYGRARETRNKRDITVEVRSVNNRYLDCTMKLPSIEDTVFTSTPFCSAMVAKVWRRS